MKLWLRNLLALDLIALAGCASYELAPLTVNHPAHPDAAVAPEYDRSRTLVYTQSDLPSARPLVVAAAEHQGHGNAPIEQSSQQTVVGEGKVVAIVPDAGRIVVEHGEIKGFMDAMTMGYRVESRSLLDGVKSGDQVRFTIDVPKKAVIKIEKWN